MQIKNLFDIRVPSIRLGLALAAIAAVSSFSSTTDTAVASAAPVPAGHAAVVVPSTAHSGASTWDMEAWDAASLGDINPRVFSTALEAAGAAIERGDASAPATLTVIDYTRPSTKKRLWVYDLRSHALLFDELVSHGRGSGGAMATSFSNEPDSHKSSLGLFRTGEAYVGTNGYSLRLDGLDRGLNDRARARAIVIHGAPYVNAATARANGYLGRSWGCPAVRPAIARNLIDTVKGGGLLFAYGAANRG
jgi:hypothetical protein